jgi:hypothetical protein
MDYARSPLFDAWVANNLLPSTASGLSRHPSATTSLRMSYTIVAARTTNIHIPRHLARIGESAPKRGVSRRTIPTACVGVPSPQYPEQVAPSGWVAVKVKGDMVSARGIILDTAGNLL